MLGASLGYSGSLSQTDYLLYLKANNLLDERPVSTPRSSG